MASKMEHSSLVNIGALYLANIIQTYLEENEPIPFEQQEQDYDGKQNPAAAFIKVRLYLPASVEHGASSLQSRK
ncbi:MAG: hypothetical protein EBT45_08110, partial [Alphaproteobacteria bacterium]|nr:hypothetical protein [Alphaproteobacteria bacterium]